MKLFDKNWESLNRCERAATVVGLVCSVSVIVLAILILAGVWEGALYVLEPLLLILMLAQTVQYWRRSRSVAIISLVAAIAVLIACIVVLISRVLH